MQQFYFTLLVFVAAYINSSDEAYKKSVLNLHILNLNRRYCSLFMPCNGFSIYFILATVLKIVFDTFACKLSKFQRNIETNCRID
jgi:hypothetical protein